VLVDVEFAVVISELLVTVGLGVVELADASRVVFVVFDAV
jgi:hypothetical protein